MSAKELNIGDYVRTEKGRIDKYSPIWVEHNKFEDNYYYIYILMKKNIMTIKN